MIIDKDDLGTQVRQASQPGGNITAAHISELIETNKALRDSVISISALLREQSHFASYPTRPDAALEARDDFQRRSSILGDFQRRSSVIGDRRHRAYTGVTTDRETRRRRYLENWIESVPMSITAVEDEQTQRRLDYEGHWKTGSLDFESEKLEVDVSSPSPYDDIWWEFVLEKLKTFDTVSSEMQLLRLAAMLQKEQRVDLFIALFGSEFCNHWGTTSRSIFEESRRFRMADFLLRVLHTGAIEYFGYDLISVVIEVAEWTKSVWTKDTDCTRRIQGLRVHCYERRVLQQPKPYEYGMVEQQIEGLLAILFALDFRRHSEWGVQWEHVVLELDADGSPLEDLMLSIDKITGWTEKMTSPSNGPEPSKSFNVQAKEFNVRTLREIGDISIVWTSNLDLHMRLTPDAKQIYVFEHPTWLFGRAFPKRSFSRRGASNPTYEKLLSDLASTYALLFGPVTAKQIRQYQLLHKAKKRSLIYLLDQLLWRPYKSRDPGHMQTVHIRPEQSPARDFLDNFRTARPTTSLAVSRGLDPDTSTMAEALGRYSGLPYPDDIVVMLLAIVRLSQPTSNFTFAGCYFEEQLRVLKAYMDGKKPRTIGQLWKDARDATSWWTFWAVLFFGVTTMVLALGSLIVGIAQTWATFQGLRH